MSPAVAGTADNARAKTAAKPMTVFIVPLLRRGPSFCTGVLWINGGLSQQLKVLILYSLSG